MSIAWRDFCFVVGLIFVLEGIMPFAHPSHWRKLMSILVRQNDKTLRTMGLVSIIFGLGICYVAR